MIENGTKVMWKGVNKKEVGLVRGFYVNYIVEIEDNKKVVLVDSRNLEIYTDDGKGENNRD